MSFHYELACKSHSTEKSTESRDIAKWYPLFYRSCKRKKRFFHIRFLGSVKPMLVVVSRTQPP